MSFDELKAKGTEAFQKSNFEEALKWYSKAIELDPDAERAAAVYSNRAACWQHLDNLPKALEDSENCIRTNPSWFKGYYRKGVTLEKMEKYDEAFRCFKHALNFDTGNVELQKTLVNVKNLLSERYEKATPESCKTAAEAKKMGNTLFFSGSYEMAAQFYERAMDLCTDKKSEEMVMYYANKATCFQCMQKYERAIQYCDRALEINSNHVEALLRRATTNETLKRWQKALDDYNRVSYLSMELPLVENGIFRCQSFITSRDE